VHQLEQAIKFERGIRLAEHMQEHPEVRPDFLKVQTEFNEIGAKVNKEIKQAEQIAEAVIAETDNAHLKQEYSKLLKGYKHFDAGHKVFEQHVREVFAGASSGRMSVAEIEEIAAKIEKEESALDKEIEGLLFEIEGFTKQSLDNVNEHEKSALIISILLTVLSLLVSVPVSYFIVRSICRPLKKVVDALGVLSEGDTSRSIDITSRDEIGDTSRAYEALRKVTKEAQELAEKQKEADAEKQRRAEVLNELTSSFDVSVQEVLSAVGQSASNLEESANSMAATVEETSQKSTEVARSSEQTAMNVQTVAAATEEMDATIREIAHQVHQSAEIAREAVDQAKSTNSSIMALEEAAEEIGNVIQLISDIAAQTNLLALNATIESARAGEAGKGFAVVAAEVKSLAEQTSHATETISQKISSMQDGTSNAVSAIEGIGSTISKLDEISAAISASIEEQTATTSEISQSVQQVAADTQETLGAMGEVKTATDDSSLVANSVLSAAEDLMQRSDALSMSVNDFLGGIKAA
jgi:methyl-accepting chemotaxis protein